MREWAMACTDRWQLAGYAGLAGFLVLEATVRAPEDGTDRTSADDRGTTRTLLAGYALAAGAPLVPGRAGRAGPLPAAAKPIGLALQVAGLGLRFWSMQTLRDSYSRTLRVTNTQDVVVRGPYQHVRHPGYLGSLLTWLGFTLTSGSGAVVAAVAAVLVPAYRRRIAVEEALLAEQLPGYADYQQHTTRLVPHLW